MRAFILAVLYCLLPLFAYPSDNKDITHIVITPNRLPTSINNTASSVAVITEDEIKKSNKNTVSELLKSVAGVNVIRNGNEGQTSSVFIRGADSRHTLVLIDGVKVNDPSNTSNLFDFAHLTVDNIEKIEVLKGPQSTLYGSDAVGGVVSITTKKGKDKLKFSGFAEAGSYNTYKISGGVSGASDKISYSLNTARSDSEGFSAYKKGKEKDGYENTNISSRLGFKITENADVSIVLRYTEAFTEFDDFGADAQNESENEQLTIRGESKFWLGDKWQQVIGISVFDSNREIATGWGNSHYKGKRLKGDWLNHLYLNDTHTFSFGLESEKEKFSSTYDDEKDARTEGYFIQDKIVINNFITTVGVRLDNHKEFGEHVTFRIAPLYEFDNSLKIKASYGTGFKSPSLYQLYSFYGNANLKPEESKGFDIGIEKNFLEDKLFAGATFFWNDIENLIDYDFATSKYQNLTSSQSKGFEILVEAGLREDLSLSGNYTYLIAENKETGLSQLRRPKHSFSLNLDYQPTEKANLNLDIRYIGKRTDLDTSFSRIRMDDYVVVDIAGSYNINDTVEIYGRIDNLLTEDYEEVYSYGTAGLTGYGGVRIKF